MLQMQSGSVGHGGYALMTMCGLGLLLGMRHSTDADHVVALSTIVSQQRSIVRAALIGAFWGVGHTITIVVVGALIILLHVSIPVRLGLALEFSVGVMLVLLGLLNLTGWMHRTTHEASRFDTQLAGRAQNTGQEREARTLWREVQRLGRYHALRPIAIGLVHGLAGSAAVALLVMSTIHDPRWATAYLFIFGAGTVVGMMLMTMAMAVPLTYSSKRFGRLNEYLANASGVVSVCFGTLLIYQLGFVEGLFSRTPHWIPR